MEKKHIMPMICSKDPDSFRLVCHLICQWKTMTDEITESEAKGLHSRIWKRIIPAGYAHRGPLVAVIRYNPKLGNIHPKWCSYNYYLQLKRLCHLVAYGDDMDLKDFEALSALPGYGRRTVGSEGTT